MGTDMRAVDFGPVLPCTAACRATARVNSRDGRVLALTDDGGEIFHLSFMSGRLASSAKRRPRKPIESLSRSVGRGWRL